MRTAGAGRTRHYADAEFGQSVELDPHRSESTARTADAVIVRYWIPQMAPALGTVCRIARRKGIKTIALLDNVVPHEKRPMDTLLTRYFLGSIDGFVYMSEQVHSDLQSFRPDKPAVFSPHPMYTNYGEKIEREEACRLLRLDPGLRYTMFFGFIRDYKGLDLLLDAWALLSEQGKNSRTPADHRRRILQRQGNLHEPDRTARDRGRDDSVRLLRGRRRGGPFLLGSATWSYNRTVAPRKAA